VSFYERYTSDKQERHCRAYACRLALRGLHDPVQVSHDLDGSRRNDAGSVAGSRAIAERLMKPGSSSRIDESLTVETWWPSLEGCVDNVEPVHGSSLLLDDGALSRRRIFPTIDALPLWFLSTDCDASSLRVPLWIVSIDDANLFREEKQGTFSGQGDDRAYTDRLAHPIECGHDKNYLRVNCSYRRDNVSLKRTVAERVHTVNAWKEA